MPLLNRSDRILPPRLRVLLLGAATMVSLHASESMNWEQVRPAKQQGPSCAFYANIPALALATGFDISSSPTFMSSVYGLRRGDFKFQRAFDKRIFCELFALPWEEATVQLPSLPRRELLHYTREVITKSIDPGLAKGWVYSLRVNGTHGGPHNVLLLAKTNKGYVVHNPGPGWIRPLPIDKLADLMTVRSTLEENRIKPVYIAHYMSIALERQPAGAAKPLNELPREVVLELTPKQRAQLQVQLTPSSAAAVPQEIVDWIQKYPGLDFAALQRTDEDKPRNVIGAKLGAEELKGVLHVSQFHLALWHLKRRHRLPVVMMAGEPWALVAYRKSDRTASAPQELAFDNGREQRWLPRKQALEQIHASGALLGTVVVE